ncbi:MAG: THUMP domain-containing protein [Candidatus Bathyarchaeota archaeon]|nr:THUMP domain-containing protein [Candidatus Bathyarchaeota archaeon]
MSEFNLLATTLRGNERQMRYELRVLLKELGDEKPRTDKTGIRGIVVAQTALDPVEAVDKLREILRERPYEFRYALRILPIQRVVPTELEKIKETALEMATKMGEKESFRMTVEKRFTEIHSQEIIQAIAPQIKNPVNLGNPNKVLLVEVLGGYTGISLIKPTQIISVQKEKML